MADEPENLFLRRLHQIDAKVERLADDMADGKVRLTAVEEAVVGVQRRIDRLEARVDRIERRLDLAEAR